MSQFLHFTKTKMLVLVIVLFSQVIIAQQGINYQGVARDADSELLISTDIDLKFNINVSTPDGTSVYSETHATTTDVNGVFSVVIGEGAPVLNTFTDINWAEDKHFLNVWLNSQEVGTTEFMATPYTKAIGKWQAHKNGVTPRTTGGSIYIGEDAGENDELVDNHNIGIGENVLNQNTEGKYNVSLGYNSLKENRSGNENIAIGRFPLRGNITGEDNIAFGRSSLFSNEIGNGNIAIGRHGLLGNILGNYNISIGYETGINALGDKNVFIGFRAGYHEEGSNKLYIDNSSNSTPLIYGDFETNQIGLFSKVGINMHHSDVPLNIVGGLDVSLNNPSGQLVLGVSTSSNLAMDNNEIQARNNGAVSDLYLQNEGGDVRVGGAVVHASDRRLKREIKDISYGLAEVLELRPTEYFWKGKEQENTSLGLIAQEVDEVIKNVVTYNEEQDKYGVSYTELIPVLIKAIQEQNKIIETKQHAIKNLKAQVETFESRLANLEGLSRINN